MQASVTRSRQSRRLAFFALAAAVLAANAWMMRRTPGAFLDHNGLAPEWPVLVDALLTVPLVYLAFFWRDGWRALRGAFAVGMAALAVAIWVVPSANRDWLDALMPLRLVVLAAIVLLEGVAIFAVVRLIVRVRRAGVVVETAIDDAMRAKFGDVPIARLLALEARMWFYALFASIRRPPGFPGEAHFSYHAIDGNASNQQAFIVLILVETPVLHVLIALFWHAQAAWIVSAISLWGLAFLVAEYRATILRPISIDGDDLVIRHGLLVDVRVPLACIAGASTSRVAVGRAPGVLRCCAAGVPNVRLDLRAPLAIPKLAGGHRDVERIFLGVDEPARLLACLAPRIAAARGDRGMATLNHPGAAR